MRSKCQSKRSMDDDDRPMRSVYHDGDAAGVKKSESSGRELAGGRVDEATEEHESSEQRERKQRHAMVARKFCGCGRHLDAGVRPLELHGAEHDLEEHVGYVEQAWRNGIAHPRASVVAPRSRSVESE